MHTVNLDRVYDLPTALWAFAALCDDPYAKIVYQGAPVEISDVCKGETIDSGFREGIMPSHIRKMYVVNHCSEPAFRQSEYAVTFLRPIDHEEVRRQWEHRGFRVEPVKQSLNIVAGSGKVVATYGIRRVLVPVDSVKDFLAGMASEP